MISFSATNVSTDCNGRKTDKEEKLDAFKLEKAFLSQHCDTYESGEGQNQPITKFNPKRFISIIDGEVVKFIEPLNTLQTCNPRGDSEIEGCSSIYTEDGGIKIGESATDWKNTRFRDVSTVASFSHFQQEDLDIDKELPPPEISTPIQFFDPLTVGEWADQLPSIPSTVTWPFSDWALALFSFVVGGTSLVFVYSLVRHRL